MLRGAQLDRTLEQRRSLTTVREAKSRGKRSNGMMVLDGGGDNGPEGKVYSVHDGVSANNINPLTTWKYVPTSTSYERAICRAILILYCVNRSFRDLIIQYYICSSELHVRFSGFRINLILITTRYNSPLRILGQTLWTFGLSLGEIIETRHW